jgi:hypothetical protein
MRDVHGTTAFWQPTTIALWGATPALQLRGGVHAYALERSALNSVLALAPVVIALPAPDGSFRRFIDTHGLWSSVRLEGRSERSATSGRARPETSFARIAWRS